MRLDKFIYLFIAGGGHAENILGKAARLCIHLFAGSPESFADLIGCLLAYVRLKKHLHCQFARLAPLTGSAHG